MSVSVVGIDVGLDGAIAFLTDTTTRVECMPTIKAGKGNKRLYDEYGIAQMLESFKQDELAYTGMKP
ncbi:MAG: hypothetical protein DRP01_11495, partial [Archaeoglobales archaeon]